MEVRVERWAMRIIRRATVDAYRRSKGVMRMAGEYSGGVQYSTPSTRLANTFDLPLYLFTEVGHPSSTLATPSGNRSPDHNCERGSFRQMRRLNLP